MRINHVKFSIFLTVTTAVIGYANAFHLEQQHCAAGGQSAQREQRHFAISSPTLDNRISPILNDYDESTFPATATPTLSDFTTRTTHQHSSTTMSYLEACKTLITSMLRKIAHPMLFHSPRKHLSQMMLIVVTQIVLQDIQWRMLRLAALLTIKLPIYALSKHKRMKQASSGNIHITDMPSLEEHATQHTTLRQLAFSELGHYLLGTYCLEW